MPAETLEAIADFIGAMQKDLEYYESISGTHIPTSIKNANDEKWELSVGAIEAALLFHYPSEEQDRDRSRLVRLDVAVAAVQELEEQLVSKLCTDVWNLIFVRLRGWWRLGVIIVQEIPHLFQQAFDIGELLGLLESLGISWGNSLTLVRAIAVAGVIYALRCGRLLFGSWLETVSRGAFEGSVGFAFQERDRFLAVISGKALFQRSSARRFRRRKLTRR